MKKIRHNKKTIIFNEDEHIYTIDRSELTSVTTFIDKFFPSFDTEMWSKRCAGKGKYEGMSQSDIKKNWKDKADKGIERGNYLHKYIERWINWTKEGKSPEKELNPVQGTGEYIFNINEVLGKLCSKYEIVEAEKVIFSLKLKKAGTIDLVMRDEDHIIIADWKFNKEIKKDNKYERAKKPIHHLDNCNYEKYALQLNFYKHILKEEDYYPNMKYRLLLIHFSPIPNQYRIKDKNEEIKKILNYRYN